MMKINYRVSSFCAVVLCLFSVFYLPYLIKHSEIVFSPSSDYGFYNLVSIVSLLVFSMVGIFIYLKGVSAKNYPQIFIKQSTSLNQMKFMHLFYVGAFHFVIVAAIYFLTDEFRWYGESAYFFKRIDRLLLGQVPYIDFEYAYGPLFLYLPLITYKILSVIGIDLKLAYYITFLFLSFLGIIFLFWFIEETNLKYNHKLILFYSISFSALPLTMGLQYVLLRCVTPLVSLLYFDKIIKKDKTGMAIISIAAILLLAFNLSISSEIFIVFFVSLIVYLLSLSIYENKKFLIPMLFVGCVMAILLIYMFSNGYFGSAMSFGAGGGNWPIIPSPSILIYLFSFFIVVIGLSAHYLHEKKEHLLISMVALIVGMMPGALGVCEPWHVFFYGIGLFVVTFVVLEKKAVLFKAYTILFVIIFCVGMIFGGLYWYRETIGRFMLLKVPYQTGLSMAKNIGDRIYKSSEIEKRLKRYYVNKETLEDEVLNEHLSKYERIAMPILGSGDEKLYDFIYFTGKYVPDYFLGMENLFTNKQLNKKLSEMKGSEYETIIIHEKFFESNEIKLEEISKGKNKVISMLFLYPFSGKMVVDSSNYPTDSIKKYIISNYQSIDKLGTHLVMKRYNAKTN